MCVCVVVFYASAVYLVAEECGFSRRGKQT